MKTQIQGTHTDTHTPTHTQRHDSAAGHSIRLGLACVVLLLNALLLTRFSAAAADPPVAGYIFWLDADQSVTQTLFQDENQTPATDGSRVAVWMDKSPSGWHVSNPADVAFAGLDEDWKPSYRIDQQYGKPAVRFEVHNFAPPEWDFLNSSSRKSKLV